jgi:hypothetical protein
MTKMQLKKAKAKTRMAIIESHLESRKREKERVKPTLVKAPHPMVPVFQRMFPSDSCGDFCMNVEDGKVTAGWYAPGYGCIEAVASGNDISIYNTLPNGSYPSMKILIEVLNGRGYEVRDYVGSPITHGLDNHRWH